jgi:hypothetical protein
MVLGIMAAPNKAMKQTSACPSFARAPGAGGALALAAYRQCSTDLRRVRGVMLLGSQISSSGSR